MAFEIKRARGKTAVYSGARQHCDHIPRLEDLCIQKLLDNVNRIQCVGNVPYYILRPLLTKVSLLQLKQIESFNPQLVDDEESDEPWKAHCKRYYPSRVHEKAKSETWRDLFYRCEQEQDHRIEKIAKRIKKHKEKSEPIRQARFVGQQSVLPGGAKSRAISAATVVTKTIKNHIPNIKGASSTLGGSSSSSVGGSKTKTITTTTTVNGTKTKTKSKAAPLMAKSKQLYRSRFGR